MTRRGDVIVVGGGVIGLTTAYFLAKDGVSVLVCDQGKLGMESSWAGAGIIPPSDFDHAQLPLDRLRAISGRLFPGLSEELKDRSGIDNGYVRCGGLEFVSATESASGDEWYGLGVATRALSEQEVRALEPALAAEAGKARHVPGMAQLRNPRHLQALRGACAATGKVTFREDAAVEEVLVADGRFKGVRSGGEVLQGESCLLAAGAWTDRLLAPLNVRLNITPVRGQIVLLNPGKMLFRHVFLWGSRYLVPRLDGRVLVGSTEEHAGYDKSTTAAGVQGLLELGTRYVPRLADAVLEKCWAGLRPGSPDGLPYLGAAPAVKNLYVASGHFRAGIQLSPGTALLMKEMILGQPPSLPTDAFRLDR